MNYPGSPLLIDFENLTAFREETPVLDHLNLKIPLGENVAIIGPNGSGKSTLLKLINREIYPVVSADSHARILGKERWNVAELREHLGLVANDLLVGHYRKISCRDVVISGFFSSIGLWPHQVVTPAMQSAAEDALEKVGITHLAGRFWTEISSGEARRAMIARALVHQPHTLILDEPSTSLDMSATRDLQQTLSRLAASGTGLILVTHHLQEIVPEIHRVILLKSGRIFRDGHKEEVLSKQNLSELFGVDLDPFQRDGHFYMF